MKMVPDLLQKWVPANNRCIKLWFHMLSQIPLKYYFILAIWTLNYNFQLRLFQFLLIPCEENWIWNTCFCFIHSYILTCPNNRLVYYHQEGFAVHLAAYRAQDAQTGLSGDLNSPPRGLTPPQALTATYRGRQSWLLPELRQELQESTQHVGKAWETSTDFLPWYELLGVYKLLYFSPPEGARFPEVSTCSAALGEPLAPPGCPWGSQTHGQSLFPRPAARTGGESTTTEATRTSTAAWHFLFHRHRPNLGNTPPPWKPLCNFFTN